MTPPRVIALDHIVLRCADVEVTLAWYLGVLGLRPVRVEEWRRGDAPFPSVRVSDDTILDLVAIAPGHDDQHVDGRLDHLCLVIEPCDLDQLVASGAFEVLEGPVTRYGACGPGTSVYVRDPDGATVELRHY